MIQSLHTQLVIGRREAVVGDDSAADQASFATDLQLATATAFRLARSIGLPPEDSADVVQDAAIRAWRHRDQRRGPFQPWFLTIVYREARRPRRRWLTLPIGWRADRWEPPDDSPPDLLSSLRSIPHRQRVALSLRYEADLTISGVASVMGIGEAAAKQLLARARESLRAALEARGEGS